MGKLSPSIRIFLVVGIVLIAYLAYQQFAPAPKAPAVLAQSYATQTQSASDGILPEDLDAHYARYVGGARDPFVPGVFPPNSGGQGDLGGVGKSGGWSLTGINETNGVPSALVEDENTGNSVFLHVGDQWNGLTVLAIGQESVSLENAMGQETQLTFPAPPAASQSGAQTSGGAPALPVPSLSAIAPLPPLGGPPSATQAAQTAPGATGAAAATPNPGAAGPRRRGRRF